jgi:hypothetical protein
MPSWKKIILSGSDAALNTLSVSNSITASVISASQFTGSLFGTSSWAIRAVSSSYLSGSTAIVTNATVTNLTVNTDLIWDSTPNTIAGFASSSGNLGSTPITWYIDNDTPGRPSSLKVGILNPIKTQTSGSHILKDGRELFTNAKAAKSNEPFMILGFGGANNITLDTGVEYNHLGIDDYDNFTQDEVYAGSLKLRKALYGITEADTGQTKLYSDGFVIPPSSPGFVLGDGGFYMFESNSMQFNPSGALLSPVASASVKFTIAPDSSSLSISVGKNDLREMLFISRSGNSPRIGVGKSNSGAALDVNGSVIVTGSLGMSGNLTAQQISASNTVRLSGAVLELPNLSTTSGNYNGLLIIDSTGQVKTLPTGSVPYVKVGSGVLPTDQTLVMFTGSTGDITKVTGVTYSNTFGVFFSNVGTSYDAVIPNLFTSNLLAVNVTSSIISASGGITGSNLSINGFPNVSASLASLASGVGTLQQVTDAGNTTSNAISSSFPGVGFFGTASWAINVVNGGGGGGGGSDSAFLNQSTSATTWSFTHNLGTQYPVITVYDTSGQVIIPQEIDGEDTNNLKIYFPTSQSGYATAVGGTSALTYYSQSLTTASVNLNTITFTKGDNSTFPIVVNTFPHTGSAIISGSLIVTGSTAITGGFEALGAKGSKIQLGTYNVGYDIGGIDTFFITGAGLIISGNMPDQNHHNFLKIGNVEMVDVNTAVTTNEFLIHNVNTLRITSGADGGNITTGNQLLKIGGGDFYVYRAGSGDSAGIIQSTANSTTIRDTFVTLFGQSGSYFYIPGTNEITTLNGTDYLMGFVADPAPSPGISYKIKADKFIWVTGSNQIISGGLTITGSLTATSFTGSLFGTASWAQSASNAINSQTASFLPIGTYNITASWAQSASNAINARTASFINNLNQNLSITGAVVLSGSSLPELRVIGETQFTGSVSSLNGFTGSLFGTSSWATNALTASYVLNAISSSFSSTASFTPNAITTASVNLNTITFTKGSGATFNITVDTGSGGGGGGSVTINNNVDNYIITATGTANTLNGEANLTFNGTTLTNKGRSNFSNVSGVANTTHYFKQTAGDTFAGFLIADSDGEDLIKVEGTLANADAKITIGDTGNAYNATKVIVDDPNSKIELTAKVYPNSIATQATALSTVGSFDIGSRIADDWSTTGPTLTAGRIVYLSGSIQWAQAQANASGSSYGMLGVVTAAESQREILIEGTIQISGSALFSGSAGQPVYLSAATAGQVTITAPTGSGQVSRVIGYITKANSNIMYFRPDNTYTVGI